MEANDVVLWFSVVVSVLVIIWAIAVIRTYTRIGKD